LDKDAEYTVYSDSTYCVESIEVYCEGWAAKGWKKRSGKVKNLDLMKPLYEAKEHINYTLKWVKGHAENEFNNLVDELAGKEAKNAKLVHE
jgi:ribonuclease HI